MTHICVAYAKTLKTEPFWNQRSGAEVFVEKLEGATLPWALSAEDFEKSWLPRCLRNPGKSRNGRSPSSLDGFHGNPNQSG
jgi:hypothetical protein